MKTLTTMIETTGIQVDDHLDRQATIPVLTGAQRQGDVIVVPADVQASTPLPAEGFPVVRGEAGGNTHTLIGEGVVFFDPQEATVDDLTLGTLTVAEGATAWLAHQEHGFNGIGPGCYTIRRQREQADVIRVVAD